MAFLWAAKHNFLHNVNETFYITITFNISNFSNHNCYCCCWPKLLNVALNLKITFHHSFSRKVLLKNADSSQAEQLQSGYKMLTSAAEMGEKFKFFSLVQHGLPEPAAFRWREWREKNVAVVSLFWIWVGPPENEMINVFVRLCWKNIGSLSFPKCQGVQLDEHVHSLKRIVDFFK